MEEQGPQLNAFTEREVTVAELAGELLDGATVSQIDKQLNALVAGSDRPKIVLDFSGLSFMSSSVLGVLLRLRKGILEKRGELRLCNIRPSIYQVFKITQLDTTFQIHVSRADALESIN